MSSCTNLSEKTAQEENINKKIILQVSALGGAILGSIIEKKISDGKHQQIAIITRATIGSITGSLLFNYLSENDRKKAKIALDKSLYDSENGRVIHWNNPESGNSGTVKPSKENHNNSSNIEECRTFIQTINIKYKVEKIKGRACRNSGGNWIVT